MLFIICIYKYILNSVRNKEKIINFKHYFSIDMHLSTKYHKSQNYGYKIN